MYLFSEFSLSWITMTVLIMIIIVLYLWQKHLQTDLKIPGPKIIPLVGNIFDVIRISHSLKIFEIFSKLNKLHTEHGNIFRLWIFNDPIVFLNDPRAVEEVLGSSINIEKDDNFRTVFKSWLGDEGLLISSSKKWKILHKIIAPSFHLKVLKSFIPKLNENSRLLIEKLETQVNVEFDISDVIAETIVDNLLETIMGLDRKSENGEALKYSNAVERMCKMNSNIFDIISRYFKPFFKFLGIQSEQSRVLKIIHQFTEKVLKEKLESKKIGERKNLPFLDHLIESLYLYPNEITLKDLKEQVDTFMFAGLDATSITASFVLCLIGIHPEIQQKVISELNSIFGDSDRDCTFSDLNQMEYLECIIFETLRLYPPVPMISRKLTETLHMKSSNIVIPVKSIVIIETFSIHRDSENFNNPENFDPDNFLPERKASRHHCCFIPFGGGQRSCLGRKYVIFMLKTLLSRILRSYKIIGTVAENDFKLESNILLRRKDGFCVKLCKRKLE